MGQLKGQSPLFVPGPPARVGEADRRILEFVRSRAGSEILDMGGGRGAYALALMQQGFHVTLAERDPACLAEAQDLGIPTLDMNVVSWEDLRGRFDTVMLIEVLEHIEDPSAFLRDVATCARQNVLLTVPCNDDFAALFRRGFSYNHVAVSDHLHQFTSGEIAELLREAGLSPDIRTGAPLVPGAALALLADAARGNPFWNLMLLPLRVLSRLGWLPRAFPSRIFAEARLPGFEAR